MCVFAIGIEDPLLMAVDRLQRRHAGEGHGVVLLGSPCEVVGRDNHCGMFAFGLRNGLGEVRDGLCKRLQLSAIREQNGLVKAPGPGHNATPAKN